MLSSNIKFQNFKKIISKNNISKIFKELKKNFKNKNDLFLLSLSKRYNDSFKLKDLKKYKNLSTFLSSAWEDLL